MLESHVKNNVVASGIVTSKQSNVEAIGNVFSIQIGLNNVSNEEVECCRKVLIKNYHYSKQCQNATVAKFMLVRSPMLKPPGPP